MRVHVLSDNFQFALTSFPRDAPYMDVKDSDIYPKYSFRPSHADKEWLDREIESLKDRFNAGSDGTWPVVTKSVVLMAVLKRGIHFFRERVHTMLIQKQIEQHPHFHHFPGEAVEVMEIPPIPSR